MIYTLTLNPAVDYYITVDDLTVGTVNRTTSEKIHFGGKGINVSLVLKELGINSTALGFVGGFTGEALENHLTQKGIKCDFVKVSGNTRINVKINDTDINANGPAVSDSELQQLYKKFATLKSGDFMVISGSVPSSLPQSIYADILEILKGKGINLVVDAEKELLLGTLKYKPFLIKPNHHELGEIFGVEIGDFETAILYAEKLRKSGAQNVMVSMGDLGAVLIDNSGKSYVAKAPSGTVISAVGSGDSTVAAFLYGCLSSKNYAEILKLSVATGSATAFSDGLAKVEKIKEIYKFM